MEDCAHSFAHVLQTFHGHFGEGELEGIGDFPSQIEVKINSGEIKIYNYAPLGGPENYVSIYDRENYFYLKVKGNEISKYMAQELGTLNKP